MTSFQPKILQLHREAGRGEGTCQEAAVEDRGRPAGAEGAASPTAAVAARAAAHRSAPRNPGRRGAGAEGAAATGKPRQRRSSPPRTAAAEEAVGRGAAGRKGEAEEAAWAATVGRTVVEVAAGSVRPVDRRPRAGQVGAEGVGPQPSVGADRSCFRHREASSVRCRVPASDEDRVVYLSQVSCEVGSH